MNTTMLEAAKHSTDQLERSVSRIIVERSPILEYVPQMTISGPAYRYNREQSLGTIQFRGVNGTYNADAGVINPQAEFLVIMGGEVILDKFEVDMMSNLIDLKAQKFAMKARALGLKYSETFFEGDSTVDPYSFDGLRKRLTGNQLIDAGDGGATLTLAMIDQLLDAVVGDNSDKVLFMNKTLRRKVTSLVSAQTGTARIDYTQDNFGRQQQMYAGVPIRVIERDDDASTFLGFDEDEGTGGVDNTASIYCVRFGMEYVHGIQGMSLPSVKDFGELESAPRHMGRLEWYTGLVVKHPRAAARLYHINNA